MLNFIWLAFLVLAVLIGGFNGRLPELTRGAFETAKDAVTGIALPLIGIMAIWLGVMRLAEQAGLVQWIARVLRPVLRRLFPEVPANHPAMGAMVMNIAANMLGLGNAATPLGLRAMRDLETLNPRPGTATNAMCTFLALNTSSVQIVPTTAIGILAVGGATNPAAIVGPAFIATFCAATVAVIAARTLERLPGFRLDPVPLTGGQAVATAVPASGDPVAVETVVCRPLTRRGGLLLSLFGAAFVVLFALLVWPEHATALGQALHRRLPQVFPAITFPPAPTDLAGKGVVIRMLSAVSLLAVPFLLAFFPLYAALRGVPVYEQFVEGAKEAFGVAQRIIPFLVAMLVAIRMFRDAGGINLLAWLLAKPLGWVQFPVELLPLAILRPLSGGASLGLFTAVVQQFGGDHFLSRLAATMYGSTETTFYVLTVYFGSVAVRRTRHALYVGLLADLTSVIMAVLVCRTVFN